MSFSKNELWSKTKGVRWRRKKKKRCSGTEKRERERKKTRKRKFLGCEWSSRYGAKSGAASIYEKSSPLVSRAVSWVWVTEADLRIFKEKKKRTRKCLFEYKRRQKKKNYKCADETSERERKRAWTYESERRECRGEEAYERERKRESLMEKRDRRGDRGRKIWRAIMCPIDFGGTGKPGEQKADGVSVPQVAEKPKRSFYARAGELYRNLPSSWLPEYISAQRNYTAIYTRGRSSHISRCLCESLITRDAHIHIIVEWETKGEREKGRSEEDAGN